jgi:hypothetical protein
MADAAAAVCSTIAAFCCVMRSSSCTAWHRSARPRGSARARRRPPHPAAGPPDATTRRSPRWWPRHWRTTPVPGLHLVDAARDQRLDLARGVGTALGQHAHLAGDDRESHAPAHRHGPLPPRRSAPGCWSGTQCCRWCRRSRRSVPTRTGCPPSSAPRRRITRPPSAAVCALCRASLGGLLRCARTCSSPSTRSAPSTRPTASRLAAVCSVRADRSCAPEAISLLECTMSSLDRRTRSTMPRSESCIALSSSISCAASSAPHGDGEVVRSPSVMARRWRRVSRRPPSITR